MQERAGRAGDQRRSDRRGRRGPAPDHPSPPEGRVHPPGQGTQARLHRRLGPPEAQRPGPAHSVLCKDPSAPRRARRAPDRRLAASQHHRGAVRDRPPEARDLRDAGGLPADFLSAVSRTGGAAPTFGGGGRAATMRRSGPTKVTAQMSVSLDASAPDWDTGIPRTRAAGCRGPKRPVSSGSPAEPSRRRRGRRVGCRRRRSINSEIIEETFAAARCYVMGRACSTPARSPGENRVSRRVRPHPSPRAARRHGGHRSSSQHRAGHRFGPRRRR